MSGRSLIYVPSPIELARDRIGALESQLRQIEAIKHGITARMAESTPSFSEGRIYAVGFGELALEAASGVDIEELAASANRLNASNAATAADAADFSTLFSVDIAEAASGAASASEYLAAARARASRLVALSSAERAAVVRFIRRCEELSSPARTAEEIRPFIEDDLERLCSRLDEQNSIKRADAYLEYLSLCRLAGERPRDLTYAEMTSAIQDIENEMYARAFRREFPGILDEALREVGLSNVGSMTLEEVSGSLVVDENDDACALFVSSDDQGSFLFTTVTAEAPSSMSQDDQFATREAISRFCSKKDRLLSEALARRGIIAEVKYEYPPDLRFVKQSDDYARYVGQRRAERRRGFSESTDAVREAR